MCGAHNNTEILRRSTNFFMHFLRSNLHSSFVKECFSCSVLVLVYYYTVVQYTVYNGLYVLYEYSQQIGINVFRSLYNFIGLKYTPPNSRNMQYI